MSLRRADPARAARRYDQGMPDTHWDGRPRWDGQWDGRPERFRPPPGVVLLVPVIISLLVQVPAAIGIAVWLHVGWPVGLGRWRSPRSGPLALLGVAPVPRADGRVRGRGRARRPAHRHPTSVRRTSPSRSPSCSRSPAVPMLWAVASVVVAWVAAIVLGAMVGLDWHPFRIALTTALLAACFGIGAFVRVRRERAAEFRAEALQRRQTAEQRERVRIARELHDVIGHALSQINVQASVGLHLMDRDPEQARTALGSIKETSKTALEEVRSVLGVIRSDGDAPLAPQAELAELPRLVARRALAGVRRRARRPPRRRRAGPRRRSSRPTASRRRRSPTWCGTPARPGRSSPSSGSDDELLLTVDDDGAGLPTARRRAAASSACASARRCSADPSRSARRRAAAPG